MDMVNVKINGIAVSVPKGSTILEAARAAGVEIPTLCFMKEKNSRWKAALPAADARLRCSAVTFFQK